MGGYLMNFITIILKEMEKQKISAYKLCKDLGMSQQTFSNWKDGKMPALDKAIAKVIYLGLSADEIFNIKTQELTTEEKALIEAYRKANPAMQEAARKLLDVSETEQERSSASRTG